MISVIALRILRKRRPSNRANIVSLDAAGEGHDRGAGPARGHHLDRRGAAVDAGSDGGGPGPGPFLRLLAAQQRADAALRDRVGPALSRFWPDDHRNPVAAFSV